MLRLVSLVFLVILASCFAWAKDWPMYRGDAARSGHSDESLPGQLALRWSYFPRHRPEPAWPRDERMEFDRAFHVAVAVGRVFFGSSADDKVYALDAATGQECWSFFTDSPVRFAPAVWKDRVFVVSDDGFLYSLNAQDGTLIGKWRGGSDDARVLGHGRIVSKWPARGGPVILDTVLYWAAGIWQSEGVRLIAMNPETGEVLWTNSDSGQIDMPQPHGGANARSGVTAQGYLVATQDQLFVPTGRAVPAAFARVDGKFQYYRLQENGQRGGTFSMTAGSLLYNGGFAFQAANGELCPGSVDGAICGFPDGVIQGSKDQLRGLTPKMRDTVDRLGKPTRRLEHRVLWEIPNVPAGTALLVAGQTIVSSAGRRVAAIDLATKAVVWSTEVDDIAYGLAAADGCLYISTAGGAIHCFGSPAEREPLIHRPQTADVPPDAQAAAAADEIIRRTDVNEGHCVDLGCGNGGLALELARRTKLQIVAVDSDPQQVAEARRKLDAAGFYGVRVTVRLGDPAETHYPKYFANLVVFGRSTTGGVGVGERNEAFRLQRPYGGIVCVDEPAGMKTTERGPLEDAGEWTHLYADPANTLCSADAVRGPLTMLWFRDVDFDMPQRHGRGPAPLFHNGRLFVEGLHGLIAVDAYNGRPLWRFERPEILQPYNADHLAGTAVTGSNFCVANDSVFLRHQNQCFRMDAASGRVTATHAAPSRADGQAAAWGYLACQGGVLYGSLANDQHVVRHAYLRADSFMQQQFSESSALFALDAESGALLWRYDARQSIRHNAIAIGGGRVFLIDRALAEGDLLSRVAAAPDAKPGAAASSHAPGELLALDGKTGQRLWSKPDAFGTMLVFSEPHDLLVMCYQATRFKLPSEAGGRMAVHRGTTGESVWDRPIKYETRPLLNDRSIVAYPSVVELLTGETKPLDFVKSYGCGQLAGSKHLLLFRSATLGYYDFTRQAGTENFGGVRPGCWVNALPVGGLVLVPDATAGCRCSYQNRAWVALEGSP